jgi:hypothetical protein
MVVFIHDRHLELSLKLLQSTALAWAKGLRVIEFSDILEELMGKNKLDR